MPTQAELYKDGKIVAADIADNSVTTAKIADNTVTTAKIADNSVTTAKISDNSVTTAKIADNSITAEKLASNSVSGVVPIGGIIMWSGTIANVPNGWNICDGTNGTPNLTNRFIVGGHSGSETGTIQSIGPGFNATTGALDFNYSPGNAGGSTAVGLTTAQLPPHNHTQSTRALRSWAGATGAAGSPNSTGAQISDTLTTTDTGSGFYHENRPPYYALAFIMRVV